MTEALAALEQTLGRALSRISARRSRSTTAAGEERASRVAPGCRFGGVWLVVTVFDGPGFSSSVLTRGAELSLRRREFDRAFLVVFLGGVVETSARREERFRALDIQRCFR